MSEDFNDVLPSGGESTGGPTQCLAESRSDDINTFLNAVQLCRTASGGPYESGGMAVIDHYHSVMFISQVADAVQFGIIPIHAEYTVGGDHPGFCLGSFYKAILQSLHIRMRITITGRFTQADAIDNRGMV